MVEQHVPDDLQAFLRRLREALNAVANGDPEPMKALCARGDAISQCGFWGGVERGWAEEARAIRDGCGFGSTAIQALGYRAVLDLADGKRARPDVEEELVRATKKFVRRQRTWFRSFPGIRWIDAASSDAVRRAALAFSDS